MVLNGSLTHPDELFVHERALWCHHSINFRIVSFILLDTRYGKGLTPIRIEQRLVADR